MDRSQHLSETARKLEIAHPGGLPSVALAYADAKTMPAIAMLDFPKIGGVADQLEMIDVPVPQPKRNEIAIRLAASAMHKDEIYAAQGTALGRLFGPKHISPENPYIMGSSVSGTIVGLGRDITDFAIGDDVIVIPHHLGEIGSWARYRCVAGDMVLHKPNQLSHVEAAALTMASCVAWGAIEKSGVKQGDTCLVVGASGAVGNMIVQFLNSLGAHVIGVCSGENAELVFESGADAVIDYAQECFGDLDAETFDVVFDTVGGLEIEQNAYRILKNTGRFITVVGPVQYVGEEQLSWIRWVSAISHVLLRTLRTKVGGPRYMFAARLPRNTIRPAFEQIARHSIRMHVGMEIPFRLADVRTAIQVLTSHRSKGRIVINFAPQ